MKRFLPARCRFARTHYSGISHHHHQGDLYNQDLFIQYLCSLTNPPLESFSFFSRACQRRFHLYTFFCSFYLIPLLLCPLQSLTKMTRCFNSYQLLPSLLHYSASFLNRLKGYPPPFTEGVDFDEDKDDEQGQEQGEEPEQENQECGRGHRPGRAFDPWAANSPRARTTLTRAQGFWACLN